MKTLLILRHAKSSWDEADLPDHDRPLSKRGKRDAPRMGRLLATENLLPDLIVSSTAVRAKKTADKVAQASGYSGRIVLTSDLYHPSLADLIRTLREIPDDAERVMIVGHNPDLESLLDHLTDADQPLSTAALAQVALDIPAWSELTLQTRGRLVNLWRPKELPAETEL